MHVAITTMSSKGQIVIPTEMRTDIREGDKLIVIKNENQLVMKKIDDLDMTLREDLRFAKRTEDAFKRYKRGKFKELPAEEFLKELEKW